MNFRALTGIISLRRCAMEGVILMATVQREYKDHLFNFLFGSEENKAWTLSLYNAVNGTDYTDPDLVQINTIREVLYVGMHNDTSFLLKDDMNLFEQQSSYNPNMPLRMMQYASLLYEKYISENDLNKFGSELLKLPVPKLIVFYNGEKDAEDETGLRLSDSFPEGSKSDIEVTVRMININHGRNHRLLDACEPLKEYSWLMQEIRMNRKTMDIEDAVRQAMADMPTDYVIRPFLDAHRMEVSSMLLTEYNEVETMKRFEKDGERKGSYKTLANLVKKGRITVEEAAEEAKMTVSEFEKQVLGLVPA